MTVLKIKTYAPEPRENLIFNDKKYTSWQCVLIIFLIFVHNINMYF